MAITHFGSASNPSDGGSLETASVSVTPPPDMIAGDLVIFEAFLMSGATTLSINNNGGQTWTSETAGVYNYTRRFFWCRFNGTWAANPSVKTDNSTSYRITGVIHVFRPSSGDNLWEIDVAQRITNHARPTLYNPFDITLSAITTVTANALVYASWTANECDTWTLNTSTGMAVCGFAQIRNGSSAYSLSIGSGYKIFASAGSTGTFTSTQGNGADNVGDATMGLVIAFKEKVESIFYYETADTTALEDDIDAQDMYGVNTEVSSISADIDAQNVVTRDTEMAVISGDIDARNIVHRGEITDNAGMSDSVDGLLLADYTTHTAGASDTLDARGEWITNQTEAAGMSDAITAGVEYQGPLSDTAGMSDAVDALNFSMILAMYGQSIRRYYCTLTGSEDSLTDLSLPIATLQARLRQGDPNYLSVTIPGMDYASAISARSNGQLVIHMAIIHGGSEIIREEIARVTLDSIRTDEGGKSKTITLSGHRTVTYPAQITALRGVTYRSLQEPGKLSFRCAEPDLYLRPGDTCNYGDDSFVAGLVQYTISPKSQSMTVTEADA